MRQRDQDAEPVNTSADRAPIRGPAHRAHRTTRGPAGTTGREEAGSGGGGFGLRTFVTVHSSV